MLTNVASQTISGTATDLHVGSIVSIYDNAASLALGTATVAADGTWSTKVNLPNLGVHSLVATDTDGAGNTGSSAAVSDTLVPDSTISGLVFLDGLSTGTYHVGDVGIAGVLVTLLDAKGSPTGSTATTDDTGSYSFKGLAPGSYQVAVSQPAGLSISPVEHASGNALLDSDVNAVTGTSDIITVVGSAAVANAGMIINGQFTGATPIVLGAGQTYDGNASFGVVVGAGNDLVHDGNGGNNVVALSGTNNLVEAGSGATNDIVTSAGSLNAQTQNAVNGFLFAGTGNNMVAGGTAGNVLVGGISKMAKTIGGPKPWPDFAKGRHTVCRNFNRSAP